MNSRVKFIIFLFTTLLFACEDMNERHLQYLETGEIIYAAKVDSISPGPGNQRIEMEVFIESQRIDFLRFYWNSYADSADFRIDNQTGSFKFMINNLEEREYLFYVISFDKYGNRSLPFELSSVAYGDTYGNYLRNRSISSISINDEGAAVISWLGATEEAVYTVLVYDSSNGQPKSVEIPASENTTEIKDFISGSNFSFITYYRPAVNSPDLFPSPTTTDKFPIKE